MQMAGERVPASGIGCRRQIYRGRALKGRWTEAPGWTLTVDKAGKLAKIWESALFGAGCNPQRSRNRDGRVPGAHGMPGEKPFAALP